MVYELCRYQLSTRMYGMREKGLYSQMQLEVSILHRVPVRYEK